MDEFVYYRVAHADPSKLLTIRVFPVTNKKTNRDGDVDFFVTNRHRGLVFPSRDRTTWRSTSVGAGRVDIHPSDKESKRGNSFIIGVTGNRDINDYVISASYTSPEPLVRLIPDHLGSTEIILTPEQYRYFSVDVNPAHRGRMMISIAPTPTTTTSTAATAAAAAKSAAEKARQGINMNYGRCVYTIDTLGHYGFLDTLDVGTGFWIDRRLVAPRLSAASSSARLTCCKAAIQARNA